MTKRAKVIAYSAAAVVLVAVFALYTNPKIMVAVSDMIWACFGTL
jgi:hypothetical protein